MSTLRPTTTPPSASRAPGNTTITLKGDNTLTSGYLHAGLEHNEKSEDGSKTGKLTITSETDGKGNNTGSLKATAGDGCAAGIGSSWSTSGSYTGAGTIKIVGGDIKAIGRFQCCRHWQR